MTTMSESVGRVSPSWKNEDPSADLESKSEQKKISSYEEAHERVMLKLKAAALRQKIMDNFLDHVDQSERETREARGELEEIEFKLQGKIPVVTFLPYVEKCHSRIIPEGNMGMGA